MIVKRASQAVIQSNVNNTMSSLDANAKKSSVSKDRKSLDAVKFASTSNNLVYKPFDPSTFANKVQTHLSISPQNRFSESFSNKMQSEVPQEIHSMRNQQPQRSPQNQMHILVTEIGTKQAKNPLLSHKNTMSGRNSLQGTQLSQNYKKAKIKLSHMQSNNPDIIGGQNTSNSIGLNPVSFSDGGADHQFHDFNDTVNQMSIDQVILEEAPLPESMEKKRSARMHQGEIFNLSKNF